MAAIELTGVTKRFGDVVALDDLSLSIDAGELFGLLGPNGAGKTTIMGLLTGQLRPDAGELSVLGIDPVAEPVAVRRRVGILPERESPPSFLTPREYFQFIGTVRELDDHRVDELTTTWANRFGFEGKLDVLATDLSRGQQQQVMIAAAFFHAPEAVFIDEPLTNLDPIVQERLKRFFTRYHDAGNTLVLSTHNVDVAAAICTTVGIVHEGRLLTEVDPSSLGADESLVDVFTEHIDTSLDWEATAGG
ncbi:MAG: ABC transporter ATP-binding protein [Halobacteriota archaeon]